jgi:hypothetical protein
MRAAFKRIYGRLELISGAMTMPESQVPFQVHVF